MVPNPDSCSQGQAWPGRGVPEWRPFPGSCTSSMDLTMWETMAQLRCFLWQFSLPSRLSGFTEYVWLYVLLIVSSMIQTFPQG